jgi:hypothetical protein
MDDLPQPELDAEEARLREIIRVAVEMAFGSFRWLGVGGVRVAGNVVSYNAGGEP